MALTCLADLVGVSTKTCSCVDAVTGSPETSTSGLFLDNLIGLKLQDQSACGEGDNLWQRATNALNNADTIIQAELSQKIMSKYRQKPIFRGYIGNQLLSNNTPESGTYKGLRIESEQVRGAYLHIEDIQIISTATETVNIVVTDRFGTSLGSYAVNVTANQWATETVDLKLELWWDETVDEQHRYFIYHDSTNVYSTDYSCGCSGGNPWDDYVNVAGIYGSDTASINTWTASSNAFGLRLKTRVDCPVEWAICEAQGDQLTSLAYAKYYRAAIELAEYFLGVDNINRYTIFGAEKMAAEAELWNMKFHEQLEYLSDSLYMGECFECRPGVRRVNTLTS